MQVQRANLPTPWLPMYPQKIADTELLTGGQVIKTVHFTSIFYDLNLKESLYKGSKILFRNVLMINKILPVYFCMKIWHLFLDIDSKIYLNSLIQIFLPTAANIPRHFLTTKLYLVPSGTNLLSLQILWYHQSISHSGYPCFFFLTRVSIFSLPSFFPMSVQCISNPWPVSKL